VLVDTLGLLLSVVVHAANIQDRDGAALVLDRRTRALFPFIVAIFADAGYQGPRAAAAARRSGRWRLRIVRRRPEAARGFVVLPKRWIVERTLAWLTRCRRLARNLENLARTSVALIRLAMIKLMARRLARS
jgi:transposase